MRKLLIVFAILSFTGLAAAYSAPVGWWKFDNSANLPLATTGLNLTTVGSHSAVAGIMAGDGAVSDPVYGYYSCTHGIAPSGGHLYVNDWSLMVDVKVPAASFGSWVSLFQTNTANSNDGDCFVDLEGNIGVGDTGYSSNAIVADTWYRIIISVSNSNFYRIYVNGDLWLEGTPQPIDGRFSLDPQILFFADDNRDDANIHCTNAAIWGQALTGLDAFSLGGASPSITPASIAGQNLLENPSAESGLSSWTMADGCDWQATDIAGWHFPRTGNYYFTPGRAVLAEINQTIDLSFIADEIDDGFAVAGIEGSIGGYDNDQGRIIVEFLDINETLLSTVDSGWIVGAAFADWTHVCLPDANGAVIPLGTRSANYRLLTQRIDGPDCQAVFDDLIFEYRLVQPGGSDPDVPSISAPASGATGAAIGFTFSVASADTTEISYQIDWGSEMGAWSNLKPVGSNYIVQHSWPVLGIYAVRVRSRDTNDRISEWSQPFTITISGDAAGVFKSQPYLQNVTQDSITIAWETDRIVYPRLDWGLTDSYGNQTPGLCINAGSGIYFCKVRIPALDSQTTYHFRARNGSTLGSDATFTTAPNEDTPFTFGVWSDSQMVARRLIGDTAHPECSTAIFTAMAANVDMAVATGDVVDNSSYGLYETAFRPYACNILGKQKPFFVAFGNHDEPQTSLIHKALQNSGMGSFSFNYGNAHFTCVSYSQLNDGTLPSDGHINSLPLDWIEQDFASEEAQNATWRFFFVHVPPYCERWFDGSSLMQTYLVPLLNQYNVQICFSGHTHEYERGMLNGTFYVVTGVCSYLDIAESITENWPHMTVGGAQNIPGLPNGGGLMHGWTEVEIDGTELNLKQHGYNLNGTYYGVIDTIHFALSDFTMDGSVDIDDLSELADVWLDSGAYSNRDIADRADKIINMKDLAEFGLYWQFQGQF